MTEVKTISTDSCHIVFLPSPVIGTSMSPRFAYSLTVLSLKLVPCTMFISPTMECAVLFSFLSLVFSSRQRHVAVINSPSTLFFKSLFSVLCYCKRRLVLRLLVSLGIWCLFSMCQQMMLLSSLCLGLLNLPLETVELQLFQSLRNQWSGLTETKLTRP